jgi:carboxyl-terminal processing protease
MKKNILSRVALVSLISLCLLSCKKKNDVPTVPVAPTPPSTGTGAASREQLTQDSIFLYAKEVYLWNTSLPTYETFKPRQYAPSLDGFNQELKAITQYSPINPVTGKSYETPLSGTGAKYSYIDDVSTHNVLALKKDDKSSVDLEGIGNDFGLKLGAYSGSTADSYTIYVQAVYPGSPAAKKGITRATRITKINNVAYGANYDSEYTALNNALNGSELLVEGFRKDDATPLKVSLTKTTYKSSAVYVDTVLTVSGTKVGYLAYARFSSMENSKADFDAAFANFAAQGVKKLVIDLRYNGGGYVNTAEYLINLISPSSNNGKVMFKERYNPLMQTGSATIMKNQPLFNADGTLQMFQGRVANYNDLDKDYFSEAKQVSSFKKEGPLEGVTDVVFIVTRNTASASELVINSLKPHLNVFIAGTKSYGKPVGFFPITINYKKDAATKKETGYDIYYSMFQTTNSLGEGDYFDGFAPNLLMNYDDASHDFGDLRENNLIGALSLLSLKAPSATASTMSIRGTKVRVTSTTTREIFDGNEFNGMIADRPRLKK